MVGVWEWLESAGKGELRGCGGRDRLPMTGVVRASIVGARGSNC